MKISLKKQLTLIFIGLIAGIIFLCWVINAFFLTAVNSAGKRKNLMQAYEVINYYNDTGKIDSPEFAAEMERVCDIYNMNYIITDANSHTVKTSINDSDAFNRQLRDIIFSRYNGTEKIIEYTDSYILSNIMDEDTQMEYMAVYGNLEGDRFFMLRTSMEGIRTSVRIASLFLLYVGIGVLAAAMVVIQFVARKISEPIIELAGISEKMAHLEFDTKYSGSSSNEIGILGKNFNEMSEKLEETIGSLKLANMELQKDVKNREEIDEMRKEFLTNVSHELKTPISLIQGYAEGLAEGINEDPESTKFYCEVIMDETVKMNKMVKELMTLSQLESGADSTVMERFDISEAIKNYIEKDSILATQEGIRVIYHKEKPIYVWADEFKIEQVFRNYFSNAVHYCGGEKEIHVKVEEFPENARVSVFNTGEPIPEEAISFLWDKFYKVDKARTREYGGSGIGLSIVKAIMETHQQKYGVTNYEDGVEFWFELSTK